MRIITLWQPWASLIAHGLKEYETRSWSTSYRGSLLIHAAKRPVDKYELLPIRCGVGGGGVTLSQIDELNSLLDQELPLGCVVAAVNLADCSQMGHCPIKDISILEQSVGYWETGRYAWKLDTIERLTNPIPWRGGQGLRHVPQQLKAAVEAAEKEAA